MEQVKSAIIGKAWINADKGTMIPASHQLIEDMAFSANQSFLIGGLTFRTDRNIQEPIALKAGSNLYFYSNKKRDEKRDADYSVSVLLPEVQANKIIADSRNGAEAWRQAHPVA